MLRVVLLCIFAVLSFANPNCDGQLCNCTESFNIFNTSCVALCPFGFTSSNESCFQSASLNLFSLSFSSNMDLSQSSIGPFAQASNVSTYPLPIYTKDRGLYFQNTSLLVSRVSWVISPWFTLRFSLKVFKDGVVFHIRDSGESFQVFVKNSQVCVMAVLTGFNQSVNGTDLEWISTEYVKSFCFGVEYDKWSTFIVEANQTLTYISFTIIITNELSVKVSQIFNNFEFLQQHNSSIYELGSANNTFTGFLYDIFLDNKYSVLFSIYYSFIPCDYPYYYDYSNKTCLLCTDSSQSVLCTNKIGHCYSNNCSNCSSFYYPNCAVCSNNESAPDCGSDYFNSTTCSNSSILYKGICISPPTFTNNGSYPVLNIKFDPFVELYGGIFQSGANQSTFGPFWNAEADDPIPVKNRGMYFSGSQFLQSAIELSLNIDFTLAMWTWSSGIEPVWSSENLEVLGGAVIEICLFNGFDLYCVHSYSPVLNGNWVFMVFQVGFDESLQGTTISRFMSTGLIDESLVQGYVFNNFQSLVYIGRGDSGYFVGYIYQILLWNSNTLNPNAYYSSVCVSAQESCVWNYGIQCFLNTFRGVFQYCDPSCVNGCSKWGTCDVCEEADCSLCLGFYTNCTETRTSTCFNGTELTQEKYCCNSQCKECFGLYFYNCRSCFSDKILTDNVCLVQCPIGYTNISNQCQIKEMKAMMLTLGALDKQLLDSVGNLSFWSGSQVLSNSTGRQLVSEGFLEFSQYDPVPVIGRGSYFDQNSFLQSEEFLMFYTFSLIFYVKIYGTGVIFTKGNSYLNVNTTRFEYHSNGNSVFYYLAYTPVWYLLTFSSGSTIDGYFTSYLYLNDFISKYNQGVYINIDTVSSLVLGNASNSFTGFIYSFSLYTSSTQWSLYESLPVVCTSSGQISCLSNCDFTSLLSGTVCVPCKNCTNGCHTTDHCNFCAVEYCNYCLSIGSECLECLDSFMLANGSCVCKTNQFLNSSLQCEECNGNCSSCYGRNFYECLSCEKRDYAYQMGVCFQNCSFGFEMKDNGCLRAWNSSKLFEVKFDEKEKPLVDEASKLGVQYYGSNQDNSFGPLSILNRGIYFNGNTNFFNFPSSPLSIPLLNYQFSLLLCLNPSKNSNPIYTHQSSRTLLASLSISFGKIEVNLRLDNTLTPLSSTVTVSTNLWTYILLSINFKNYTLASLVINKSQAMINYLSQAPFIDNPNSLITIGTDYVNYFQGFVYSVSFFFDYLTEIGIETQICTSSEVPGTCLNECQIDSFYNLTDGLCYNCLSECVTGCSNNFTCAQCDDIHCIECGSYNSCDICQDFYEVQNKTCYECELGFYYYDFQCHKCKFGEYFVNETCVSCPNGTYFENNLCKNCENLCLVCESAGLCLECVKNAILDESGSCSCYKDYSAANNCSDSYFNTSVILSFNNTITLIFSEELNSPLTKTDLNITLNSKSLSFNSTHTSSMSYQLNISYPSSIDKGSKLHLDFSQNLKSVKNSVLHPFNIIVVLYPVQTDSLSNLIASAKSLAKTGVTSGLSIAAGNSFLTFDPTSFFSFLSTAELYYPISLYGLNCPENLNTLFANLRVQSSLPNVFAYMINDDQGSSIEQKYLNLGFRSSLMLVNIGLNITIGIFLCATYMIIRLLSFIQSIKPYVKIVQNRFEYGVFIKYWIQTYLEFLLGAFTSLNSNKFSNALEIFDFMLALIVSIVQITGIIFLVYLIVKRAKISEDNTEKFTALYGIIFIEFKSQSLSFWIYYLLYIIRRLCIIFFAEFITADIIKLSISFSFSLCVFFYIVVTRCFKSLISNTYIIANELLCIATHVLLFYQRLFSTSDSQEIPTKIVITVTVAWALNIVNSVALSVEKFIEKRRKPKIAKVANIDVLTSVDKYVKEVDENKHCVSPEQSVYDKFR